MMKNLRAVITPGLDLEKAIAISEFDAPQPKADEVIVRMRACSLNYRDLIISEGGYPGINAGESIVPLSDGSGEVIQVGSNVTKWKVGDRVISSFFQDWIDGPFLAAHMKTALGGGIDGVLCTLRAFPEHGLARLSDKLTWEEGATLPCAALTAWHALFEKSSLDPSQTVLTLGTGGVSTFALQFAKKSGAKVIATSSSIHKLKRLEQMGADEIINYQENPDWDQIVLKKTQGKGVDHVIEVGGAGTMPRSMAALKNGGRLSLIGRLTGIEDRIDPRPIMGKGLSVQGIYVGSVAMLERMSSAIEQNSIEPIIDKVFPIQEAAAAYKHLRGASHFGKIVITL
jgi:NADPH:quinone reductase-like Zn-dependent oxidoreductase